ncbi:MAG: hypothetical protein ACR2NB_12815 [Solirubrobacteraceae bacterium]
MRFARSPAGRRAMDKAKAYASSPEGKQRIEDVKGRVQSRRGGPAKPPSTQSSPPPADLPRADPPRAPGG